MSCGITSLILRVCSEKSVQVLVGYMEGTSQRDTYSLRILDPSGAFLQPQKLRVTGRLDRPRLNILHPLIASLHEQQSRTHHLLHLVHQDAPSATCLLVSPRTWLDFDSNNARRQCTHCMDLLNHILATHGGDVQGVTQIPMKIARRLGREEGQIG